MKNTINTDGKWEILGSEYLFRRPWLTVRKDCVKLPNGQVNDEFYVLEYPDWVNVSSRSVGIKRSAIVIIIAKVCTGM